jgi:mRNA-degrading endonuclease RelE of RelBE toxin-antitoxin system
MKYSFTERLAEHLESFSGPIQNKFWKQLNFLLHDLRHPSLQAKKYDETRGIWQARVDQKIRFYFLIEDDTYVLLNIKRHSD